MKAALLATVWSAGCTSTGASLTLVTATVAAIDTALLSTPPLLVPPLSVMLVSVTTRLVVSVFSAKLVVDSLKAPAVGSSVTSVRLRL